MSIEFALLEFPKALVLDPTLECEVRALEEGDEKAFHDFFLAIPEPERMFIKHRVVEREVIHRWCTQIDLGRHLPLLAVRDGVVLGCATLHQQLGGWKRHIGRVSVMVHPGYRGRGIARSLVGEIIVIARNLGLEKLEAEFIGEQEAGMKTFALHGFRRLLHLEEYVKDMQAISHDYFLMGLDLTQDEEYAGVG